MKARTIILWTLILIVIDQSVKIIINAYFVGCKFDIIPSLVEFNPTFNVRHSYVNTLLNDNFGLNVGLLPHVILYLFIGILIYAYFSYMRSTIAGHKILIDGASICFYASLFCALIGNLIWKKGTLDYIELKPLFVFDLKDIYIDSGIVLFLLYIIKNKTQLNQPIKTKNVFQQAINRLKKGKK